MRFQLVKSYEARYLIFLLYSHEKVPSLSAQVIDMSFLKRETSRDINLRTMDFHTVWSRAT